jgi:hypothetical protein
MERFYKNASNEVLFIHINRRITHISKCCNKMSIEKQLKHLINAIENGKEESHNNEMMNPSWWKRKGILSRNQDTKHIKATKFRPSSQNKDNFKCRYQNDHCINTASHNSIFQADIHNARRGKTSKELLTIIKDACETDSTKQWQKSLSTI